MAAYAVYTLGCKSLRLDQLLDLLSSHNIRQVIDVRTEKECSFSPKMQLDSQLLKSRLPEGITYRFAGKYLGPGAIPYDKMSYEEVSQLAPYQQGIARLLELAEQAPILILALKEDPRSCYRHRFITRSLLERGCEVYHAVLTRSGGVQLQRANPEPFLCASLLNKHGVTRLYHITHIENLPSILEHDLCCKNLVTSMCLPCTSIADPEIQDIREVKIVCQEQGFSLKVHDFVPLFFHYRPPMLLRIKLDDKLPDQRDVAYLTIDPQAVCDRLDQPNSCYFADGNVAAKKTRLYSSPKYLDTFNWSVIQRDTWNWDNPEEKRVKGAEVLVRAKVFVRELREIAVIDSVAKDKVLSIVKSMLTDSHIAVIVRPTWYF